jgi:hypothetical protein
MKVVQLVLGAAFIALGLVMLFLVFRDGGGAAGNSGQAWLAPLGLIGAGALSISHARRKPKKW